MADAAKKTKETYSVPVAREVVKAVAEYAGVTYRDRQAGRDVRAGVAPLDR